MTAVQNNTIATAANETYARCLWQLLRSAERQSCTSDTRWIAYDLGMSETWRKKLSDRFHWCEFRTFNFDKYPPHFALKERSYAWKPIIIHEVAQETPGAVLWMDSANILKQHPEAIFHQIAKEGFYAVRGQASLGWRCDPRVLRKMKIRRPLLLERECTACVFGITRHHPVLGPLLDKWQECSMVRDLIRPPNAMYRHMDDQALLSCLLLTAQDEGKLKLREDDVDISSPHPVKWLTTRNKVPVSFPTWLDWLPRAYYSSYKWADQRWISFKRSRSA